MQVSTSCWVTVCFVVCIDILRSKSTEVVAASQSGKEEQIQQRLIVGIVCDDLTSTLTQRINATWWQELKNAIKTKSGTMVKVDLLFMRKSTSQTLSAAKQASTKLREESISLLSGRYDSVNHLATVDQQMPYIVIGSGDEMRWSEMEETSSFTTTSSPFPLTHDPLPLFRLMPSIGTFHGAIVDIIRTFRWEDVAVIYDSVQGLELVGLLMDEMNVKVRGWRLNSRMNDTYLRDQLSDMRLRDMRHIAVVCQPEMLERLLKTALKLSMLSFRYSWIFVHPLPTSVDYEPFSYTGVNLTTLSILSDDAVKRLLTDQQPLLTSPDDLLTFALFSDSLHLVMQVLETMTSYDSTSGNNCSTSKESGLCHHDKTSMQLMEKIKQVSFEGNSGKIRFDSAGRRMSTTFRLHTLTSKGLEVIGEWNENGKSTSNRLKILNWTHHGHLPTLSIRPLQKSVHKVVTIIDHPFVMHKQNYQNLTGNDRYEGFLIDLFDKIAKEHLHFQYELYESPDGKYGSMDADGNWNGMIRELIVGNASMCLGAISITSDREKVVDFAKPFKQKMFNFLMKKPGEVPTIFQFLSPLSNNVWVAIVSSLILVSFLLFVMDRFSPNFPVPVEGIVRFGLSESIWFMYGGLVGGGTEGWTPRTISSRLLTSAWWFFGLIIISSYTANLAAFLTVTRIETPIKSIADLAAQTSIRYGTVRNTYAMSMFKNSQLELLRKMWYMMGELHPDWMVDNTTEGIAKVKEGDYAFIWDAPINRHTALHDCSVISTGEPFDEKGYGIGMPIGASYRDDITMAILNLGEKGEILKMENRWWSGGECPEFSETSTGDNEELKMVNVAGVFLLLSFGAVLAIVTCIIEIIIFRVSASKNRLGKQSNNSTRTKDQHQSSPGETETPL